MSLAGCARPGTGAAAEVAAGSEILWDRYGVPHIFAADRNAMAHAFGWAQMRNHGDLLLRLYVQGRGRAAELLGEPYLAEDRWVWQLGIPQRGERWFSEQTPASQAHIAAFVGGINAFAAAHPELVGDSLRAVLPVTETDVLTHAQRLLFSGFVTSRLRVRQEVSAWQDARGSNAWAIAPRRTAGGHALLLANPHLPWGDSFTLTEAQLVAPGVNLYGATLVGAPVLLIAFNDHLGWTLTVNTQDGADLYELKLTGSGYEWDGGHRAFDTERHVLQVRAGDGSPRPDTLVVRRSVHGPVVAQRPGSAVALRVVGLDLPGLFEQLWRMGTARDFRQFVEAIRPNALSAQNITYADAAGHIAVFYGGNTPVRSTGGRTYWEGIVPGIGSTNLWTRLHPFDDMPKTVDPPSGWVQNANDPPWWATFPPVVRRESYPDYLASTGMSLRAQRSAQLAADTALTLERLAANKHSTAVELANRVLDDLIAAADRNGNDGTSRAAQALRQWDRTTRAESRGGVLFAEWWRGYAGDMRGRNPFAVPWTVNEPRTSPRGISDMGIAVRALEAAATRVDSAYGSLTVPWGEIHRLRRDTLDLPGNGGPGTFGIFRVVDYVRDGNRFRAVGGDSYVAAIEFSNPIRARSLIGYGNASRHGSPHRTDQLELFSRGELKPVWRSRAEIMANLQRREAF